VYAAGTGRRPFYGLDDEAKYPELDVRASPVRSHRRLPARLADLVDACLEPDSSRRPTPEELFDGLERLVDEPA
jgi:hypothetical protein